MEILKQEKVEHIEVIVRHPRSGFSQMPDGGWTIETTAQSIEYTKTLTPKAVQPVRRFAWRSVTA